MRTIDISAERRFLDDLAPRLLPICSGVAAAGFGIALVMAGMTGTWDHLLETYLVSFAFFLSLSLGGLFFVMLQHVTRAGWSVAVRRLAEGVASNVLLMAVLILPVLAWMHRLYPWTHAGEVAADPVLAGKAGYLNPTFFVLRFVLYFGAWILLARYFHGRSTAQDRSGDPDLTVRMERRSAPGLVLFAVTVDFAAFDLLMSLDPRWFSTIFGVYYFSAAAVGFLAFLPCLLVAVQERGGLTRLVTVEHYHDVGKLLFAFIVFWAYIAFSQYLLIWYGNLPEETVWYLRRQTGSWTWISLTLLFGHFVVPFLVLVSRFVKRRPRLLAIAGAYMLLMCWIDIYWLVIPEFSPGVVRFGALDVLCFLGMAGAWLGGLALQLRRPSLIPERDPRLDESLAFHNV
jgi:hypothetical protein